MRLPARIFPLLLAVMNPALFVSPLGAEPSPLSVRSAFLPEAAWRLGFGGGVLKRSGAEQLYSFPELEIAYLVPGRTELSVSWPFLILNRSGRSTTAGPGDFFVSSRVAPWQNGNWAAAFLFGVKLPNAKDEKRLGTDETDFYFSGLFSQRIGFWEFSENLGLGILGSPTAMRAQEDVYTYGFSAAWKKGRMHPFVEWHGQVSPHPEFVFSRLSAGAEYRWPKMALKISGLKSLTEKPKGYQNILGADRGVNVSLEFQFGGTERR